jgi:hypothetical protein
MQQGIARSSSLTHSDALRIARTTPPFQSVAWKIHDTPERVIGLVAQLLGAAGVHHLEMKVEQRGLSCAALKAVLAGCATRIRTRTWGILTCDDAHELDDATPWARVPSQLSEVSVDRSEGSGSQTIQAVDALLARVGGSLAKWTVTALDSACISSWVDSLVADCTGRRELSVRNAATQFYQCLLQVMDDGRYGLSTLTAQATYFAYGTELLPLREMLQDRRRGTRVLRSLAIGYLSVSDAQNHHAIRVFIEILATNTALTSATLYRILGDHKKRQLQALPLQCVIRPPSLRRRLALLSVIVILILDQTSLMIRLSSSD